MKKQNAYPLDSFQFIINKFKSVLCAISIIIFTINFSLANPHTKLIINDPTSYRNFYLPDSTDDSTSMPENFSYGDTMSFYLDGPDTIYVLFVDTTTNDSISSLEGAFTSQDIFVTLSSIELPIQTGLYGFNISDFYRLTHYDPNDNGLYLALGLENPNELIVALAPKNLRYPSGASSKFRHALGSWNLDPDNPHEGLKNGGYGINIEELIPFYDKSNGMDYPCF